MPMPFSLECRKESAGGHHHRLIEWHTCLASAIEGMLDHQQRGWDSVRLTAMTEICASARGRRLVAVRGQQMALPFEGDA
jgi:hypothetical protein